MATQRHPVVDLTRAERRELFSLIEEGFVRKFVGGGYRYGRGGFELAPGVKITTTDSAGGTISTGTRTAPPHTS